MNKEEIEESNVLKVKVPLITDEELRKIDDNFNNIVNEFLKNVIYDKELAIAQYIISKQQRYIEQLENKVKELEKVLDERFVYVTGARTVYGRLMQLSKEIIVKDDLKNRNEIKRLLKENKMLENKVKEQKNKKK